MPHRYFTREVSDGRAVLSGTDAHHLVHVMRAGIGDEVVLCGPDALEYTGRIESMEGDRVVFTVSEGYPSTAEPRTKVTLYAAYPKQGKLEEVIRHGVELGVTRVVPFFSRYCVAAPKKEEAKNERYNRIAAEAAKQCGRGLIPEVGMPCRILLRSAPSSANMTWCCFSMRAADGLCGRFWPTPPTPPA